MMQIDKASIRVILIYFSVYTPNFFKKIYKINQIFVKY